MLNGLKDTLLDHWVPNQLYGFRNELNDVDMKLEPFEFVRLCCNGSKAYWWPVVIGHIEFWYAMPLSSSDGWRMEVSSQTFLGSTLNQLSMSELVITVIELRCYITCWQHFNQLRQLYVMFGPEAGLSSILAIILSNPTLTFGLKKGCTYF